MLGNIDPRRYDVAFRCEECDSWLILSESTYFTCARGHTSLLSVEAMLYRLNYVEPLSAGEAYQLIDDHLWFLKNAGLVDRLGRVRFLRKCRDANLPSEPKTQLQPPGLFDSPAKKKRGQHG